MNDFIDYLENIRADHTLSWIAQSLATALSKNELALLIEHLEIEHETNA